MPSITKKRCPKGLRRSKKTGECEKNVSKSPKAKGSKKRCPAGFRRSKKTGNCEKTFSKSPKGSKKRCPSGSRRNKKTGKCEKTSSKSPKKAKKIKIILDSYINDIYNYYDVNFLDAIQIFNYDRNDLRKIYINKQTILGFFIISGYLNVFKEILDDSLIIKSNNYKKDILAKNMEIYRKDNKFKLQEIKNEFIKCIISEYNDCRKCNRGGKSNQMLDFCESGIFKFIFNKIKDIKFDINIFKKYFSKIDDKDYEFNYEDMINIIVLKLSIFLYYFLNVDKDSTAFSIMNHYVLYFLKSAYKNIYNIDITYKKRNKLISKFLLTNTFYKILYNIV